jgi:hypothetical protein
MANESLIGGTLIVQKDIPQTSQESFSADTVAVHQVDTPQTIQEPLISVTPILQKDTPQTIQEPLLYLSIIKSQVIDIIRRCMVSNKETSINNMSTTPSNIWIDKGMVKVIVQNGIPNSQIVI